MAALWSCPCKPREHRALAEHPPLPAEQIAHLSPDAIVSLQQRETEFLRGLAMHEAAHATVSLALGHPVVRVQSAGSDAHCKYAAETLSADAALLRTVAGPLGEDIARGCVVCPSAEELAPYIEQAKRGEAGTCDRCVAARLVVSVVPDADAADMSAYWIDAIRRTLDLLDHDDVRAALRRVALALDEHVHLSGGELLALVDVDELQRAAKEVAAAW